MFLSLQLIIKHPQTRGSIIKTVILSSVNTNTTNTATLDIYSKLCHSVNEIVFVLAWLGLTVFLLFCNHVLDPL